MLVRVILVLLLFQSFGNKLVNSLFFCRYKIGEELKDTRKAAVILGRNSAIVEDELSALETDLSRYLISALQNYSQVLKLGNKHNIKVFRLISLW